MAKIFSWHLCLVLNCLWWHFGPGQKCHCDKKLPAIQDWYNVLCVHADGVARDKCSHEIKQKLSRRLTGFNQYFLAENFS